MKIRSDGLGMLMGLCTYKIEAAEKEWDKGWPTQIFSQWALCWDQFLGQTADFTVNNSLESAKKESVENLIEKRDQLDREVNNLTIIPLKYIPCEVLFNFALQQEEIRKKTNERNRLTSQIAQMLKISGDN